MDESFLEDLNLAVALVRYGSPRGCRWLAVWDQRRKHYDFVVGQQLGEESFRETVLREVSWELRLDRRRDFLVSNMAQANLQLAGDFPGLAAPARSLRVAFYNVELYRAEALSQLNRDPRGCWLSSQEICCGIANDDRTLNPLLVELVRRSQVIQPWESSIENGR